MSEKMRHIHRNDRIANAQERAAGGNGVMREFLVILEIMRTVWAGD